MKKITNLTKKQMTNVPSNLGETIHEELRPHIKWIIKENLLDEDQALEMEEWVFRARAKDSKLNIKNFINELIHN